MIKKGVVLMAILFILLIISSFTAVLMTQTQISPATIQISPIPFPSKTTIQFFLKSDSFQAGAEIPKTYAYKGCGDNTSPPLTWGGVPEGTKSLALQVSDIDANNFVHWLIFDISASILGFPEGEIPEKIPQGTNDFGQVGWGGPCPPSGTHNYTFTLYALDTNLNIPNGVKSTQLLSTMQGHILGQATLTGLFSRK
jgi:Raf kinase inhibitor-like YbhB/YbcL family protein